MGPESRSTPISASSPASSSSPSGKRTRDPEDDEVYLDNLRSQKRYLSEIMACSLNGLTVGDSLPVNMLDSPSRSDTLLSPNNHIHRDDLSLQYSPMSEDSDEARFCEDPITSTSSSQQPESRPTSPVSPYRYHRPLTSTTSHHLSNSHSCPASMSTNATTPQSRPRGSDTEGRFPSSPSDICHSSDLRRTALLRSVQMRTQPCGIASTSGTSNVDGGEEKLCFKSMEEDNRGEDVSYTQVSGGKSKSCKALDMRLCER
ncbi:hypothetical protein Bca4012_003383 [Brassica carinata]|uniref:Uncharacterized protein n=5 Tax=Brassica TaxID=3705 RepID=A0A0D3B8V5_BRAOL|nr:PREDICTED: uncharacterized protein LOC106332235 [Brassica oleracea var. oleracea]XP_022570029.1 uncharacterized protein LOC111212728 [Brassica napus]KAG2297574.1 hypothetical protein Bca52824_044243 [Brassica carinata]VDC91937.1 unnamed protein product [Brassica oleracea]CAF1702761.1 unnamed protein product [Brassica napus]CDY64804.1 BnaCnng45010D [Brassica napus]